MKNKKAEKEKMYEIAMISAIISNAHCESILEQRNSGFFDAIDVIQEATMAFYKKFEKPLTNSDTDWMEECEKHKVSCYDDLIEIWSMDWINKKYKLHLSI